MNDIGELLLEDGCKKLVGGEVKEN